MESLIFTYPEDPPAEAVKMSRSEFLKRYPRYPTQIITEKSFSIVPMSSGFIACDFCSNSVGDIIFVISDANAICQQCANRYVIPYLGKQLEKDENENH